MARIKQVHDEGMVARLWLDKTQDSARNKRGHFYFDGNTIYSYGSHFPIAIHHTVKKKNIILFTTQTYSPTTSGHVWSVKRVLNDMSNVIFCDDPKDAMYGCHTDNIRHWLRKINIQVELWGKATKPHQYIDAIDKIKQEMNKYCVALGHKLDKNTLKSISHEVLAKRAAGIRIDHLEQIQATKEANKEFRLQVKKGKQSWLTWNELWRNFREDEFGKGEYADCSHDSIAVYKGDLPTNTPTILLLRLNGDFVESSNCRQMSASDFCDAYEIYKWMLENESLLDQDNGPETGFELFCEAVHRFDDKTVVYSGRTFGRREKETIITAAEMDMMYERIQQSKKMAA